MATEERFLGALLLFLLIWSRIEGSQAYSLLVGCIWLIWTELLFLYDLLILKKIGIIGLCLPFHWTVVFRLHGPINQNFTSETPLQSLTSPLTSDWGCHQKLKLDWTIFVYRLLQTLLAIHVTVDPRLVDWLNQSMKLWKKSSTVYYDDCFFCSFSCSVLLYECLLLYRPNYHIVLFQAPAYHLIFEVLLILWILKLLFFTKTFKPGKNELTEKVSSMRGVDSSTVGHSGNTSLCRPGQILKKVTAHDGIWSRNSVVMLLEWSFATLWITKICHLTFFHQTVNNIG